MDILSTVKGVYTLKVQGKFPERILNIATSKKIFIQSVTRDKEGNLIFRISKKGYDILCHSIPEDLVCTVLNRFGLPFFIKRYKKRFILFFLPLLFVISYIVFSMFIWDVEISGGTPALQKEVCVFLSENGLKKGCLIKNVNQYDLKRKAIMNIDSLSWLWVNLKGTTASVEIRERKKIPHMYEIHEPSDVISTKSGIIEKMQVYSGIPMYKEGDVINKGDIIISGILKSEDEKIPPYFHHARGDVYVRLLEKKSVDIPAFRYEKTPTGNKKTAYFLKFGKNNVKFSLNSSNLYTEYVTIKDELKLPFIPLVISKTDYHEVNVKKEKNNISAEKEKAISRFRNLLQKDHYKIEKLDISEHPSETGITLEMSAQCICKADKEIPLTVSAK